MKRELETLRGQRVFVGLSGGVDSAVTAALLQDAGAKVTAVFIKGWYPPDMPCTWRDDRRDAMRVAAHLHLPFVTLDASAEYKTGVIDYLLREYKAGRTPNPDIMCNKDVKFGAFHAFAKEQGADAIATGHYAQAIRVSGDAVRLARGIDPDKDQSYFLWAMPSAALTDTYFPLGGMHKKEVRALAEKFELPNARKRDSQGICFLGNVSVEEFLAQEFGTKSGTAFDAEGNAVGTHAGALLSTLGQRVHLEQAAPGPWYVIAKDIEANTLTVAKERQTVDRTSFILEDTNWLQEPVVGKTYTAQYRYHGPRVEGTLDEAHTVFTPTVSVKEPVASGQSLVIYDEEECIGGGIIA
ncbi:MAG TPA: tRNA 2-thiouridine(34) synthase MnmA [Candidatus Paceibacterota bacterium]|nr:tRNA 2-thiouridine(34) synthase MnmA [Candidatus Paceibacterota bacterium]